MNGTETDVLAARVFKGDFVIPPLEPASHEWQEYFLTETLITDTLNQPPHIAKLLAGTHVWNETAIHTRLDEAGELPALPAVFELLRTYRKKHDLTLTLSESLLVRTLGEQHASVLHDIDLADRDAVARALDGHPPKPGVITNLPHKLPLYIWDRMEEHEKERKSALREKK